MTPPWPVDALLGGLVDGWRRPPPSPAPAITEITLDVEEVRPGTLFIARTAWWSDTHALLGEACARGAAALVVSRPGAVPVGLDRPVAVVGREDPALGHIAARFYGHPTRKLEVVGITGTNGKTSTTWIVERLWAALGRRPARMGTLGYTAPGREIPATNTTPDALVIQRFAHDALALGADGLVLEVSSHGLSLERVAGVAFDAVGFTQLGRDHLDFHGDLEDYRAAKARLFGPCLQATQIAGKAPRAVAWVDDPEGARMLAHVPPSVPQVPVGTGPAAALRVAATPDGLRGSDLTLRWGDVTSTARLALPGDHDVANASLALALVARSPDGLAAAAAALAQVPAVPGRLERAADGIWVDYAHTPDAVARIIAGVRARAPGERLHVVVGCGGDRDRGKRPLMARAAEAADAVWHTADNPRSESAQAILDDMAAGSTRPAHREPDRARAIAQASAQGALTLVLGKGHETTQQVGTVAWRFDDREVARRAAAARAAGLPWDRACWAWGLPDPTPAAVLAAARAAPGGLWVLGGRPDAAALTARFGDHWLACRWADLPAELQVQHRAVVLVDPPASCRLDGWGAPPAGEPPGPVAVAAAPKIPSLWDRRGR
ncbi:MAG: UDP-N-acetylmuramoyl-L-alanyl-D-glutamate--2,6-diaminopimelate ligase [Myxococcales bacterium]|nr:UDP-N-acetylmuramoyl-L-alanyl-D-glutamate--2,6-diaminopimelate ligase [Myxococcales bacterium]